MKGLKPDKQDQHQMNIQKEIEKHILNAVSFEKTNIPH